MKKDREDSGGAGDTVGKERLRGWRHAYRVKSRKRHAKN